MSADEGNKPCVQTNTPKDCQQDLLLKILTKYLGILLLLHNWVFDSRVKIFGKCHVPNLKISTFLYASLTDTLY